MEKITTENAPPSIGPFSQGVVDHGRLYISGQGPINPRTDDIIDGNIYDQTVQTLENVGAILDAAGSSFNGVVKTTVYVIDMSDYNVINKAYSNYFSEPYPARSAIQVESLPVDIDVEIEAVATVTEDE